MKARLIITCVIFGCLTFGCRNLLSKYESDVTAEVVAHSWRRTIVVEQLETKTAEAWEDEVPKDAVKIISKTKELHHYDGKIIGEVPEVQTRRYKCGERIINYKPPVRTEPKYCEEKQTVMVKKEFGDISKPVYATKVKYQIEVWTNKETKDLTGYDKDISKAGTVAVDNKTTRIGRTDDGFTIELKTPDGRKYPKNVTKEVWEKLNEGQQIKCKIDLNDNLSGCEF